MEQLHTPHPTLPGCFGDGRVGQLEHMFTRRQNENLQKLGELSTVVLNSGLRAIIDRNLFPEHFGSIDQATGLKRTVLLASGMQNISAGNLAIVPSCRIGLAIGEDAPFAFGPLTHDEANVELSPDGIQFMNFSVEKGKRKATGTFLGVVVNSSYPLLKKLKPAYASNGTMSLEITRQRDIDLFLQAAGESAEAVIAAERNFRNYTESGTAHDILTPAQIGTALDWVLWGERE
ncbi:MAG: hypothetical protein TR69_WS6001000226 [candidate division WS6 bacterium OLB20]|uniref:Uncharacterized protein n=1 Tax=candidate division WS6 bacterium OLB20 TaxID=1617426 RepID=A0A136M0C5_9BACT|nr:MAG: hypothetical protein TR69_WS6001000226 [candidate division WS6 bacterium OLB20]